MTNSARWFMTRISLMVALGGFLMGFDASVVSGVTSAVETEFQLSKFQLGWVVASLTLTASLAMLVSGPLSDRLGRRKVLIIAAWVFFASAVLSALAPSYEMLAAARMLGGFGVGAALIVAPMYIAELAPAEKRGYYVSFNQFNIVLGISVAFFSNYLILEWSQQNLDWLSAENAWRWMLGIEAIPAILYAFFLLYVPESPRWLMMKSRQAEARAVLERIFSAAVIGELLEDIKASLQQPIIKQTKVKALFNKSLRPVLVIGIVVAIMQQLSGINAIFFYAPMIFEKTGVGTNAAFAQAVYVGLTNLIFTILAMFLIDRLGRRPLLLIGLAGIAITMSMMAYGFEHLDSGTLPPSFILFAILGFVAMFAISLGPVMWVLFSEIFPNHIRGVAISFVGLINSGTSFLVQLMFPWQLDNLGTVATFLMFSGLAVVGWIFVWFMVPETKSSSLEQLEKQLSA